MNVKVGRALALVGVLLSLFMLGGVAHAAEVEEHEACHEDCFLLSSLVLRGKTDAMTFELKGSVRARPGEIVKVPLFGPPSQVRLDGVTIDGSPAAIGFDSDRYHLFTPSRSFTVRGSVTLGSDQMLSVPGPIVSVDARLSAGKCIEGERLSGVVAAVLHFDPMTEASEAAKPKPPPVFRLARALRFGREPAFLYKLTAHEGADIGTINLPLRYGEKVSDVQGSTGWSASGSNLSLPVVGQEAEITISGTLPESVVGAPKTYTTDSRSAYEWWLIEADPEHRVDAGGDPKLVETQQSPIPPQFPGARVFLVQKGQSLEVDAQSLVRGEALAAVARTNQRFVAITGRGELISDETLRYDNNGLDHLMLLPAGKPMYLSTDQSAERILHTKAGSSEVLVPVHPGTHQLRVQSLAEARIWPVAGALTIPPTTYPIATSAAEMTIGLPDFVHPIAVLGGDHTRWVFSRGDLIAVLVGVAVSWFGFRTRKTRALASVVTAGLWFVSREGFVVAAAGLTLVGAIFLASRFWRGSRLLITSGLLTVVALLAGRFVLSSDATAEPTLEMIVTHPTLPHPESSSGVSSFHSGDPKANITPVSISFPTSERYVQTSRQLVSGQRPFSPRVLYVTDTFVTVLQVGWLALLAVLVVLHKGWLLALKDKIVARLTRRSSAPDPITTPEAPPF